MKIAIAVFKCETGVITANRKTEDFAAVSDNAFARALFGSGS